MKQKIKLFLKRSIILNCCAYIIHNLCTHLRGFSGDIESTSGTTHSTIRNAEKQSEIYEQLSNTRPTIKKFLENSNLADDTTFPMIKRYYGKDAAGETFFDDNKGYDIIISRSVLEHLNDPIRSLHTMYKALNPGGQLIHKVDLRDHAMLTPSSHDSTFLTILSWIYGLMTKGSGFPNRVLFHEYKQAMNEIGCMLEFFITGFYGAGSLEHECEFDDIPVKLKEKAMQHFNRYNKSYASKFKDIAADNLIVSGFFLVATKT